MIAVYRLYRELLAVLPTEARRFLNIYSWSLASLAIFDAAALALMAAVIAPLAVGSKVELPFFGQLGNLGVILAIIAVCALMIFKGVASAIVLRWGSQRIAKYEVALGDRLFRSYLGAPWQERLTKNSSDMLRFTDSGVDAAINSFLRPGATLLAEIVSLFAVVATLAIIQPVIAVVTVIYLLLLGALLYFWISRHARRAGEINLESTIRTSRLILEIVSALKEVTLRGKEETVAAVVGTSRTRSARARANTYFLGQLPRYVMESGVIGGFIVVGGAGYLLGGPEQAISAVAVFGLAGFRMAPSVSRFQTLMSQMLAASSYPRRVVQELRQAEQMSIESAARHEAPLASEPRALEFRNVSFSYSSGATPAIKNVSLTIPLGSSVAFVGASGSGKSTMIDLILGLLEPQSGEIWVDEVRLSDARRAWRQQTSYVPQEVAVFDSTVAQNVALTWSDDFDRPRVIHALDQAQVLDIIESRDGGVDASVGERGLALSGGQRQRLGIARALYTNPMVLVMDEATSALDTQTEADVTAAIAAATGDRTLITVAHRLSTVRNADLVFFMRDGEVVHSGTFDEVVAAVPDFAKQAALAGLTSADLTVSPAREV
ncbi:ABC transporter ATP-binding protein [Microbacterium sp. GXF6406]